MAEKHAISAHYLAKSLPLALIEKRNELALVTRRRNALIFGKPEDQMMIVFSYGVVVFFNFEAKHVERVIEQISKYGEEPVSARKTEEYGISVDPSQKISVEFERVVLDELDRDLVYVVAEVLAQSVAIEYVEERVGDIVSRFEKVTSGLEQGGQLRLRDGEVLKTIGAGLSITHYVISQLSLLDKPDSTWEDKDVEATFVAMRKMFELEDRFKALEFRLDFMQDTSELVLDILQTRKAHRMELAIIYLFVADIVLVLYELFWK